jgi:ribosomal protein S18 acetylase RimI-like enzyme
MKAARTNAPQDDWREGAEAEHKLVVRLMTQADLATVLRIDSKYSGRPREAYLREKFEACVRDPGINTSLIAEYDGTPAGFLFGKLFFGEFGIPDTRAVLYTLGVQHGMGRHGVGRALLEQYRKNLQGLRVDAIDTLVDWERGDLTDFFRAVGFRPSRSVDLVWDTRRYRFAGASTGVTIRRATAADLAAAGTLAAESGPSQSRYLAAKLAAANTRPDKNLFIVAELDGAVAGVVVGSLFGGEFGIEETRGVIDFLAVKASRQHHGIGSAIFTHLLERVNRLGVPRMETLVRWNNWPLLRFFEYVGFRPSTRLSLEWHFDRN